jgi:2-amino-4-hydroxy-6-hydroxymethyldihydropteridine diphosphokinase
LQQRVCAFVALGANLGDPTRTLVDAIGAIDRLPETHVTSRSSFYRSAPVDAKGPDFINAVVAIETGLPALELLGQLHAIEHAAGRERPYRNAPRTLDLDLLLYADDVIATPVLTVPHPRMHERAFVLLPLAEIAPQRVTPQQLDAVRGQSIKRVTV